MPPRRLVLHDPEVVVLAHEVHEDAHAPEAACGAPGVEAALAARVGVVPGAVDVQPDAVRQAAAVA